MILLPLLGIPAPGRGKSSGTVSNPVLLERRLPVRVLTDVVGSVTRSSESLLDCDLQR